MRRTLSLPYSDDIVTFIDNAENRIVVEYEAEWYESKFEEASEAQRHLGLGIDWSIRKVEFTGDSYIITLEKEWV